MLCHFGGSGDLLGLALRGCLGGKGRLCCELIFVDLIGP